MAKSLFIALGLMVLAGAANATQDPTAPLGWQAAAAKPSVSQSRLPSLEGIFCDKASQDCTVVLSGKMVSQGGSVNGYQVAAIYDDAVIVKRGGRQWRLEMFADNIKSDF